MDFSEPGGDFRSSGAVRTDNLVSNERTFQLIIPALQKAVRPGAYLGVGPEQNFTYIAALKPTIAFIIDIRRDNMLLHLMYKALIEMSANRVEFLSNLFARSAPAGLGLDASAQTLLGAFRRVPCSEELKTAHLHAVFERLERVHGFTLRHDDESSIADAYSAFCVHGPDIRWDSSGDSWIPSYADLMTETDVHARPRSYLAFEENFQALKAYETNNSIVPLVGDFAGDKTIRSVGRFLKNHNVAVAAFYTSNVESYLFGGDRERKFLMNVSTLPVDERSTFIRTHFTATRFNGARPDYETRTVQDGIKGLLRDFERGHIRSYADLLRRSNVPLEDAK